MERKVYIILTDTGTIFTRMIKLYTKKPYNHASISFDPYFSDIYSFGRKNPRNPFVGGFVVESIHQGLLKKAKCAIYCCTITEQQYKKMNEYLLKIEEQKERYRYNLIGLFAIALNKEIERERAFFCSQFVTNVLTEGDVIRFSKHASHVTPYDFQQVPHFQLIYQGNFEDYKSKQNLNNATSSNKAVWIEGLRRRLLNAYSSFLT